MLPQDKLIWDEAYNEEYDGLANIPTWEVISKSQFKLLSKGAKPLPSMAISTIKYVEILTITNGQRNLWLRQLCLSLSYAF